MGLSASQARFLQLTARRSNIEYQAQQINFQRLQWAEKLAYASEAYQNKTSNRKMVFSFNDGQGITKVDVTYSNYKNYMNQQMEGLSSSQDKMFLVSSSGNKIVVGSEAERDEMIERYTQYSSLPQGTVLDKDDPREIIVKENEEGVETQYFVEREFTPDDFIIVDDLDDVDNFQNAIQNGTYFFAKRGINTETGEKTFKTEAWDSIGNGAISQEYDKSDDAVAEAEYKSIQDKVQNIDKKLEMELSKLEGERSAIQTEIESIKKQIEDNIKAGFKAFS